MKMQNVRWLVIGCSLAVFFASLFFPALLFADHEPQSGATLLAWGWWGLLTFDFAWFANPAYLAAMLALALRFHRAARILSAIAVALACLSFTTTEWWFNEGNATPVLGLGPAFYLWLLSLGILLVGSFLVRLPSSVIDAEIVQPARPT
jgi:hypothetical protein